MKNNHSAKASALSNFVIRTETIGEKIPAVPLDAPELIFEFHRKYLQSTMQEGKEHLHVLLLDARLRIIGSHLVSMGGLTECPTHPREILRPVIIAGAYGFALTHNHPSGDPSPSRADEIFTRRISEAANLMQIRFLDHVVIGEHQAGKRPYYSFREAGTIA